MNERHVIPVIHIFKIQLPVVRASEFRKQNFVIQKRRHFFKSLQKFCVKLCLDGGRIFCKIHEHHVAYTVQCDRFQPQRADCGFREAVVRIATGNGSHLASTVIDPAVIMAR